MSQTLLDHFETLAQSQGGVAKLRELILQLAVQGKLVSQDAHSSHRQADSYPGVDGEGDFPIPDQWRWVRLKDIGKPLGQKTPDEPFSYIDVASIDNKKGVISSEISIVTPELAPSRARKMVRKGSLIYSTVRPYLLNVAILDRDFFPPPIASTAFAVLNPSGEVDIKFVYYYLRSKYFVDYVASEMTGVAYPAITEAKFYDGLIPLPPLEEQRRIVAKVDELMRLCDALEQSAGRREAARQQLLKALLATGEWEQVLEGLETLVQTPEDVGEMRRAVLQLAVQGKLVEQDSREKPAILSTTQGEFDIPDNWSWVYISDVFEVSGGIQKTPSRKPDKNAYPYLRVANVQRGRLDLEEIHRFELHEGELDKYRLEQGDLLIVEGNGSESEIGRCAVWGGEIENCVHQNHIMRARARIAGLEKFALLLLNSPIGIAEMKELAITTSGLFTLSVGKIRGIQIPLPPQEEQHRIVAKVDRLMALCDTLETALGRSQQTLAAAMASAVAQAV